MKEGARYVNMGAVRYILAVSVIIYHVGGLMGFEVSWPIPSYIAVGSFFALSGFLVFGSFLHSRSLKSFLARRARRIMPPYISVVLFCAVALAGVSTFPVIQYFTSPDWWRYLVANLSFMNFLAPTLPGVFDGYDHPAVNGSLWTMKVEWMLYLSVPVVAWFLARFRSRPVWVIGGICILSVVYRLSMVWLYGHTGNEFYNILSRQVFGQLSYFYAGVLIYFYRESFMRYRYPIAIVSLLLFLFRGEIPYFEYLFESLVVAALVISVSIIGSWGRWLEAYPNVSYQMYLFHCPLIQLGVWFGLPALGFYSCVLIICALTFLCALLSWHTIDKRVLNPRPSTRHS